MRTMKIALVLLALVAFIGATMAVASAATETATVISAPAQKVPAMTPQKMSMKVPTLEKIGFKMNMLNSIGSKAIDEANAMASNAVKSKAAKMTTAVQKNIVQSMGKMSGQTSIPGMGSINPQLDHLRQMPAMSTMNMPDWTSPGIILTI